MNRIARRAALAACIAFLAGGIGTAQAESIALTNNVWQGFDVDQLTAVDQSTSWINVDTGNLLSFTLTTDVAGVLKVVDLGNAGDTFNVTITGPGGVQHLTTSSVPATSSSSVTLNGADAALADPAFSRGLFDLGPGTYTITGSLLQSALIDGTALNATPGAIEFSTVPLPAGLSLLLSGLAALGAAARRRGVGVSA